MNKEKKISLLRKCADNRNRAVKERKAKQRRKNASHRKESNLGDQVVEDMIDIEEIDEFEIRESTGMEEILHREAWSMENLLTVIHTTGLADALLQGMVL